MNEINLLPAVRVPFPLIFLSNLFVAFEAKSHLAKGIAILASGFCLN